MMQSVPVLILVLCCMASAHKAIHHKAIHHLKARQDCSLPNNYPDRCIQAFDDFTNSDLDDVTTALLDGICEEACVGPLNDYFECLSRSGEQWQGYTDYLCAKQNDKYCLIIYLDLFNTCDDCENENETCPDTCRSCVSRYVDDLSCCFDQYRSNGYINATELQEDGCGNRYDTCSDRSGSAIAVPTVLTALLLMVMAAIAI